MGAVIRNGQNKIFLYLGNTKIGDLSDSNTAGTITLNADAGIGETGISEKVITDTLLPNMNGIVGLFYYGNLDGFVWYNSCNVESFIVPEVTNSGSEYIFPAYTSDSYYNRVTYYSANDFSQEITMYALLKYATNSRYAVPSLNNNEYNSDIGIGIGGAGDTNHHYIYSKVNNTSVTYETNAICTDYALITVSANSTDKLAHIFVNGQLVKNDAAVSLIEQNSSYNGTMNIGLYVNSNCPIYMKCCAFGTEQQTDAQIIENCQYIMNRYNMS